MIQRKFVSIFSVEEFIFENENKNNITFKRKFLTYFMLFVALFVRNKLSNTTQSKKYQKLRYITAWKIVYAIIHS